MQRLLVRESAALVTAPWMSASLASRGLSFTFCKPGRHHVSNRYASTLNFLDLDQKWQKRWEQIQKGRNSLGKDKSYVLAMFPYPSGNLHMGHVRVYTIADVLARFKKMQGSKTSRDVIYPMGWDAFGLPAENAAIERGLDPAEWTKMNIAKMKQQLQGMNTDIDWNREFVTCEPDFYKHTQRIFLLLHEHGLAYQAKSVVNYDLIDQTVLANEQVDSNGRSWRSGAKVEKINLKQWFLKITDYKEELLQDLKLLKDWPKNVITMQQNWLGRSQGTTLSFPVSSGTHGSVSVFTTRLDTLLGVQFLALSASHPLVIQSAKHDAELQVFLEYLPQLPEGSKDGYQLKDISATNPLCSITGVPEFIQENLPIYVTPYVKDGYGEGAIMGVPAHDERDFAFWTANTANRPIRQVIGNDKNAERDNEAIGEVYASTGRLTKDCGIYAGLSSEEASQQILADLKTIGIHAERTETWRLRDWLISRQRYWGAPIPIIHCNSCGAVPVPVADLPVELPKLAAETFRHRKGNPLEHTEAWLNVPCPKCNAPAKRETDTMDTFVDSSWYMFRFLDPKNNTEPFSKQMANAYMPVNTYIGGIEHAILHLLYARFIAKFLARAELWPLGLTEEVRGEPFQQLISQGMVHGKTFSDPDTGRFLKPEEVDSSQPSKPIIKASGQIPNITFEKMSKSKYNGVDPTDFISRYGADATRVHILFQAPISEVLEWDEARIAGVQRWMVRLHKHIETVSTSFEDSTSFATSVPIDDSQLDQHQAELYLKTLRTISSITTGLAETQSLNTCISDLMILTNEILALQGDIPQSLAYHISSTIIRLTSPFAPAFAEECWEILHADIKSDDPTGSVFEQPWPEATDLPKLESWAKQNLKIPCAIMENGKLRMVLDVDPLPQQLSEEDKTSWAVRQIRSHEQGASWLGRKEAEGPWNKVIVVPGGRTINFVGGGGKKS